jgi:hypothetical protein
MGVLKPSRSTEAVSRFNLLRASVFRFEPDPDVWTFVMT